MRREVKRRRDWTKLGLGVYFAIFLFFLYIPMILMAILSFQGSTGQLTFPFRGPFSLDWWKTMWDSNRLLHDRRRRQRLGPPVPLARSRRGRPRGGVRVLAVDGVPPPLATQGRRHRLLHPHARADDAGLPRRSRQPAPLEVHGRDAQPLVHGARCERDLGDPVRLPRHARRLEPLRQARRGGGSRPRRERPDDVPRGDAAARLDGHLRQLPVRLHPGLERLRPDDPAAERLPGAAASDPDRHLAVEQADPSEPLRARGRDDRGDAVPDPRSCSSSSRSASASAPRPCIASKRSSARRSAAAWTSPRRPRSRKK